MEQQKLKLDFSALRDFVGQYIAPKQSKSPDTSFNHEKAQAEAHQRGQKELAKISPSMPYPPVEAWDDVVDMMCDYGQRPTTSKWFSIQLYCKEDYWAKMEQASWKVMENVGLKTAATILVPTIAGELVERIWLHSTSHNLAVLGLIPFVWNLPRTMNMVSATGLNIKKARHNQEYTRTWRAALD